MKSFSFLAALLAQVFAGSAKRPDGAMVQTMRRKLLKNPSYDASARHHGNARRLAAHRRACLQAYEAKRILAAKGKGRNSIEGIPST